MEFNNLLRKQYANRLFDLALFESTTEEGNKIISKNGGTDHQILSKHYTSDGGHLNIHGSKVIADKLLSEITRIKASE